MVDSLQWLTAGQCIVSLELGYVSIALSVSEFDRLHFVIISTVMTHFNFKDHWLLFHF